MSFFGYGKWQHVPLPVQVRMCELLELEFPVLSLAKNQWASVVFFAAYFRRKHEENGQDDYLATAEIPILDDDDDDDDDDDNDDDDGGDSDDQESPDGQIEEPMRLESDTLHRATERRRNLLDSDENIDSEVQAQLPATLTTEKTIRVSDRRVIASRKARDSRTQLMENEKSRTTAKLASLQRARVAKQCKELLKKNKLG
ncbi:hypothetical protein V1509DRAFT_145265 [Lipomyces kononenkoae]